MKIIDFNGNFFELIYQAPPHYVDNLDHIVEENLKFFLDCSNNHEIIEVVAAHLNYWISQDDQRVVDELKSDVKFNFLETEEYYITPTNIIDSFTPINIEIYEQLYGDLNIKIVDDLVQIKLDTDHTLLLERVEFEVLTYGESIESYFENEGLIFPNPGYVYYFIKSIEVKNLTIWLTELLTSLNNAYTKFGFRTITSI
jgi:hypothetical protein